MNAQSKDARAVARDRLRKQAGRRAEDAALAHLQAAGLRPWARNYRCKAGEIDLVLLEGSVLVLAEVRYRTRVEYGGAAASVTWRKQRRLARAAGHLLLTHASLRGLPVRFDVIAMTAAEGACAAGAPAWRIEWIKNAFQV
jgi:putative endonuclease